MAREVETKFKVESPEGMRELLIRRGARFMSRELEKDIYYSLPQGSGLSVVRLRHYGQKGLFTIKSAAGAGPEVGPGMKVAEESQVEVDDPVAFSRMLGQLGFTPQFGKEKIRESYDWRGVLICLDELPHLGFYLEIEAPPDEIRTAAKALGLDMSRATSETYLEIFARYKAEHKAPDLKLFFELKG